MRRTTSTRNNEDEVLLAEGGFWSVVVVQSPHLRTVAVILAVDFLCAAYDGMQCTSSCTLDLPRDRKRCLSNNLLPHD